MEEKKKKSILQWIVDGLGFNKLSPYEKEFHRDAMDDLRLIKDDSRKQYKSIKEN